MLASQPCLSAAAACLPAAMSAAFKHKAQATPQQPSSRLSACPFPACLQAAQQPSHVQRQCCCCSVPAFLPSSEAGREMESLPQACPSQSACMRPKSCSLFSSPQQLFAMPLPLLQARVLSLSTHSMCFAFSVSRRSLPGVHERDRDRDISIVDF